MTIEELLAEVAAANVGDEGLTCPEWAHKMGCSILVARARVKRLLLAGRMAQGRAPRTAMDGRTFPSPVYRLIPATNGKKR